MSINERFMTSNEVAALLKLKPQTLAKWRCTNSYELPYIKVGNRVLYKESDVILFIQNMEVGNSLLATRKPFKDDITKESTNYISMEVAYA